MTTLERIAVVMGCTPEDDDDLVEATRLLVAERDAARAEADALRVALADTDLIMEQRERQITASLTTAAEERARCAAVCREVMSRYRHGACGCIECDARGDGARECAEAIERGPVTP